MKGLIDRSPGGFVDALCARIKSVLEKWPPYEGEFRDEEFHAPHVHAQYLPSSKTGSDVRDKTKDYPLVQVVCVEGEVANFSDAVNGSGLTVHVYFGGYRDNPDNQGWRIPSNMMWRVMQDLLSETVVEGYQIVAPIKWSPLNSKEPPYYWAQMETKWKGGPPAIEVPVMGEEESFGNGIEEQFVVEA